jgi:CheY-like chemotaxis protein
VNTLSVTLVSGGAHQVLGAFMADERRKHQRIPVSLEVVWEAAASKHDARMSDLSFSGCYIDTIGHVSLGEAVVFRVHLPTGHWVQLRGEVAHHLPGVGIGLRLTRLTEEEQILIEQVLLAHGCEPPVRQSQAVDIESGSSTTKSQAPPHVLVADDDPMIRHLATVIIQKEGYSVIAASDGREAFDALRAGTNFVAAILDMVMPGMDGLALVRHIKREQRLQHIPVGIITAEQDPKLWDDSITAGAGIFLPKPFTTAQLKFMLRVLLKQGSV